MFFIAHDEIQIKNTLMFYNWEYLGMCIKYLLYKTVRDSFIPISRVHNNKVKQAWNNRCNQQTNNKANQIPAWCIGESHYRYKKPLSLESTLKIGGRGPYRHPNSCGKIDRVVNSTWSKISKEQEAKENIWVSKGLHMGNTSRIQASRGHIHNKIGILQ